MGDLDVIIEPTQHPSPMQRPPAWAFFPRLRLLLGWGYELCEALGAQMSAVRTVFVYGRRRQDPMPRDMPEFLMWREAYDRERPPMPFYARSVTRGGPCISMAVNHICTKYSGPYICPPGPCYHPVEASMDYRVGCAINGDNHASITVEKRAKTLKPAHAAKMAELGLPHKYGTGNRSKPQPADQPSEPSERNRNERAFQSYLDRLKQAYHDTRLQELLTDPTARPPYFLVQMAKMTRERLEAVAQGKNDMHRKRHRPYEETELLFDTCHAVASIEATGLAFDYQWKPVFRFDETGLTPL